MLSPRTISLRIKNRALLKSLEKYTEKVNQNIDIAQLGGEGFGTGNAYLKKTGFDPINNALSSTTKCIQSFDGYHSRQDSDNTKSPLHMIKSCIPEKNASDCFMVEGNDSTLYDNSLETAIQNKKILLNQTLPIVKHSPTANCSQVISTDDLQTIVGDIASEIGDTSQQMSPKMCSSKKKNYSSRNSSNTNIKAGRCRPILLEQQRAAEAQMHAPTHSHSLSKCYCIGINNTRAQPDEKYVVQVYGRKQHIPSRLKRQRYRADSISRHSRTVRWADSNNGMKSLNCEVVDKIFKPESQEKSEKISQSFSESLETSSLRTLPSDCQQESETSLIDRVKTFREVHWSDCHALPQGETSSSVHECVQHYVLNKRSFLEPLYAGDCGEGGCSVCSLLSKKTDSGGTSTSRENCLSHVIVTLPTLILEPSHTSSLLRTSTRRKQDTNKNVKPKPCFAVAHHCQMAKEGSLPHPTDSLALRYQKKAY